MKLSPELHIQLILQKCVGKKQSEGNSRSQNLLTEIHYIVHTKNKSIWRKTFLSCCIVMEAEEEQQQWKTNFYSELPKVVRIQPQNSRIVANYNDFCVVSFHKRKVNFISRICKL